MEASLSSSVLINLPGSKLLVGVQPNGCSNPHVNLICRRIRNHSISNRRERMMIAAINDVSVIADSTPVDITWQIVVGAIAGVTPFVVAGIEFSKRIIAQRRCEECGGSGLVLRDTEYFKCPGCGGFLPWQSWRRFFWG